MALMDTIQREILEERLEQEMEALSQEMYGKRIAEISDKDLYYVILNLTKGMMSATIRRKEKGILYFRRIPYRKAAFQQPDKFRGL